MCKSICRTFSLRGPRLSKVQSKPTIERFRSDSYFPSYRVARRPLRPAPLAVRLQPAVGGKEFVPHAHDCIGRFFEIDVFGGRCLRNNSGSCLKCIALKGAEL